MPKMKKPTQFRFKRFAVWHHRSAMKVGVDGVLVGCWTDVDGAERILDVGTGCGVIALIMAQRKESAHVTGIDIDIPSVLEARENAGASPWKERLEIIGAPFPQGLSPDAPFDLIVSNPPYFDSGVTEITTPRERARHQNSLSPSTLLEESVRLLRPGGRVAMIVPSEFSERLCREAAMLGYVLERECHVRGHVEAPCKRTLLQWRFRKAIPENPCETSILTLEVHPGEPTSEYRELCRDFYLKY